MPNEMHRKAQEIAAEAATALEIGTVGKGLQLYAQAADLEEQAFKGVSEEKARTRSILAVSFIALLYKAQLFERAELGIFRLLGLESLQPWAVAQLRELLQVVSDERVLADTLHTRYSGESITVALRGGEIGTGTGPLDLILDKAAGLQSLLYRFAEWKGEYPLRRSGSPPKNLTELIQARVTEPSLGSYKLEIRLTEPIQQDMFKPSPFKPTELSDAIFDFYGRLTGGDPTQIDTVVPQVEYRKALLLLTRNVSPRGRRVREIALYRTRKNEIQSVYLTDAITERIKQVLPKPPRDEGRQELQLCGTLRALHLDKNWLELTLPNGVHETCFTLPDMLDDVVGPLVNKRVIVRGPKTHRGRGEHLLVQEIELAEEEE